MHFVSPLHVVTCNLNPFDTELVAFSPHSGRLFSAGAWVKTEANGVKLLLETLPGLVLGTRDDEDGSYDSDEDVLESSRCSLCTRRLVMQMSSLLSIQATQSVGVRSFTLSHTYAQTLLQCRKQGVDLRRFARNSALVIK